MCCAAPRRFRRLGAAGARAARLRRLRARAVRRRHAQRPGEQASHRGGAVKGQVQAVGLKPGGMPGRVPTQSRSLIRFSCRCASAADQGRVVARPATRLARRDQAEGALLADDVERVVDVVLAHRPVGAERQDDQPRQLVAPSQVADQRQALAVLTAAAGVRAVALVGDVGEREQHRRVADRDRRPADADVLSRLLLLDAAAGCRARAEGASSAASAATIATSPSSPPADFP